MKETVDQLLEEVEPLKNILVATAVGEFRAETEYPRLRLKLIKEAAIKDKLPLDRR